MLLHFGIRAYFSINYLPLLLVIVIITIPNAETNIIVAYISMLMSPVCGDNLLYSAAAAALSFTTSISTCSFIPFSVSTVIKVFPTACAITFPFSSTVNILSSDDVNL